MIKRQRTLPDRISSRLQPSGGSPATNAGESSLGDWRLRCALARRASHRTERFSNAGDCTRRRRPSSDNMHGSGITFTEGPNGRSGEDDEGTAEPGSPEQDRSPHLCRAFYTAIRRRSAVGIHSQLRRPTCKGFTKGSSSRDDYRPNAWRVCRFCLSDLRKKQRTRCQQCGIGHLKGVTEFWYERDDPILLRQRGKRSTKNDPWHERVQHCSLGSSIDGQGACAQCQAHHVCAEAPCPGRARRPAPTVQEHTLPRRGPQWGHQL